MVLSLESKKAKQMSLIVIALDPGVDNGGAIAFGDRKIISATEWHNTGNKDTYTACAQCAQKMQALVCSECYKPCDVVLVHEAMFLGQWQSKGLPGIPQKARFNTAPVIELAKSVGIWIGRFPKYVHEIHVSTWRSHIGINPKTERSEAKRLSVQIAREANGGDIRVEGQDGSIRFSEHLADAYNLAQCWLDKVELLTKGGVLLSKILADGVK